MILLKLNKYKYSENFLALLSTNQFTKSHNDPKKVYEAKIKQTIQEIKHKLTNKEY